VAGNIVAARVADPVTLQEILVRAAQYVRQLEHDFTTVISDESYEQHVQRMTAQVPATPTDRRMSSEMLFMWLADERTFLSVRNVLVVDGRTIPDSHDRIEHVLAGPRDGQTSRLRQLLDEGARFNLGPVIRNVAEPTLALEFLDPDYQPRFAFSMTGRDRIANGDVVKLEFTERQHPTVITDNGHDVLTKGTIWLHSADGGVVRTVLQATIPSPTNLMVSVAASITVTYNFNEKLKLSVPSRMDEHYVLSHDIWTPSTGIWAPSPRYESTNCVARYSNYRRFETAARILPRPQ
jgi:hypothetical protein